MAEPVEGATAFVNAAIATSKSIRGRTARVTISGGLLMASTALLMIVAVVTETWNPSLGLALGLTIPVLATGGILALGGLIVETWIFAIESKSFKIKMENLPGPPISPSGAED